MTALYLALVAWGGLVCGVLMAALDAIARRAPANDPSARVHLRWLMTCIMPASLAFAIGVFGLAAMWMP